MKKIIYSTFAALMSVLMLLCLAACSGKEKGKIVNNADDLEGAVIGVQKGTTGAIYAMDIEGATIEHFNKGADAIMSLNQGKVDAVIIDNLPAQVFVEKNKGIKILDDPFEIEDYAMCIAKENIALLDEFNTAITTLKANGTLQALLDYYIEGKDGAEAYTSPEGVERSNGTLKMATNATFPPYEYFAGGEIVGFDVDFSQAICDILGYELVVEDMDFDAIIVAVQSGKADFGAAGLTVTEDRLKNINFTESYCTGVQVIIVKK